MPRLTAALAGAMLASLALAAPAQAEWLPNAATDTDPAAAARGADDGTAPAAAAGPAEAAPKAAHTPLPFALHAQTTYVDQWVGSFAAPYSGPQSLTGDQAHETFDLTVFAGVRLGRATEIWVNPEIDQGFGLSNTLGAAGYFSAEAYKVGQESAYFKLPRLFIRHTINLGGADVTADPAANQFAAHYTADRIVLTAGKFGVGDVFDTNKYAHDARGDFLNWAFVDTGNFDYAANSWGFTFGASAEWYHGPWTLRLGVFNLSKQANGPTPETDFSQNELVTEIEHRHTLFGHDGAVRVLAFRNRGKFGRYDQAVAAALGSGSTPDVNSVAARRDHPGIAVNAEQGVTESLGVFLRAGISSGAVQTYDFTDIDRTVAFGASSDGKAWGRPQDTVLLGVALNGISKAHQAYFNAGGLGLLVGDGQLPHRGDEAIIETSYTLRPRTGTAITFDVQRVANPGYNRDRGPVTTLALRLHAAF